MYLEILILYNTINYVFFMEYFCTSRISPRQTNIILKYDLMSLKTFENLKLSALCFKRCTTWMCIPMKFMKTIYGPVSVHRNIIMLKQEIK